jgi:hypothetical protein
MIVLFMGVLSSNENKMSDGGRERVSLGVKMWKSSQKWSAQRSAVRSIAWLGVPWYGEATVVRSLSFVLLPYVFQEGLYSAIAIHFHAAVDQKRHSYSEPTFVHLYPQIQIMKGYFFDDPLGELLATLLRYIAQLIDDHSVIAQQNRIAFADVPPSIREVCSNRRERVSLGGACTASRNQDNWPQKKGHDKHDPRYEHRLNFAL